MTGTRYTLEVRPSVPATLKRLGDLANDLAYTWERPVRRLFYRLDPDLWDRCRHNPKVFLRRISQARLKAAAADSLYMQEYASVVSAYDAYFAARSGNGAQAMESPSDLVAYFCAEYGFHESLPIYSGGLGILAGDHCKAASDLALPFVAVGLLYRQGYFNQTINAEGWQQAHYHPNDFNDLAVQVATTPEGEAVRVEIEIEDRTVFAQVWEAKAGNIRLFFLDTDIAENRDDDRQITYQLYGGDSHTRIKQEMVLGIGGVRALRALGLQPSVWHINEGHAAFQILERCRELKARGLEFSVAMEAVAAATVFTTHTPVAAGHDIFDHSLMSRYFQRYIQTLGLSMQSLFALDGHGTNAFNMTILALRGSRHHNGVSRIHGGVASHMESDVWPEVPPTENPIRHVTNGVHVGTFLAHEWANLFDLHFGGEWRARLRDPDYWEEIYSLPDHSFWSVRQSLKRKMLETVYRSMCVQHRRNGLSEAQIERLSSAFDPSETDFLTIGFARRFATYKRATLIFSDPERLARILNNPERPVVLIFAGKAHPNDRPGQELIRVIHEFSRRPEFEGRILMLEGYDLALGRRLVSGVDVWLNNPQYPMEASGTSGEKAAINGVLNLSVLDGWWAEGFDGANGWGIVPHGPQYDAAFRDSEEANELYDLLEKQIVPLYYDRRGGMLGYSKDWVNKSKQSIRTILPQFNAQRMVMDYVTEFYLPAQAAGRTFSADDYTVAQQLTQWKEKVRAAWPDVRCTRLGDPPVSIGISDALRLQVAVESAGLTPEDLIVECVVGDGDDTAGETPVKRICHRFTFEGTNEEGAALYGLDLEPPDSGLFHYSLRVYPYHSQLIHPFEMGCMRWL